MNEFPAGDRAVNKNKVSALMAYILGGIFFFLNVSLFLRERERERERERQSSSGRGAEREGTQNRRQAPGSELSAQSPIQGLNPCEIMT